MTTRALICPTCGQPILPSVGECLYCASEPEAPPPAAHRPEPPPAVPRTVEGPAPVVPPPAPPQPPASPAPPEEPAAASISLGDAVPKATAKPWAAPKAASTDVTEADRALGLLLFEGEECLARGQGEKALVLASKAVRDRPDSITARALYERARRDLLKGRRRDRLEARVREAQGLLEGGDFDGAERIVTSALKLIPDHGVALQLFSRLKERRLGLGTVEAEAERELDRIAQSRASQALEAARSHLRDGRDRSALLALRKGLRWIPDHPALLGMLRDLQSALDKIEGEAARRRAFYAQIHVGLDHLARGEFDESLRILRAVLLEDPRNARAQAAIQEVRQAWLARPPVIVTRPIDEVPLRAVVAQRPSPSPPVTAPPVHRDRPEPPPPPALSSSARAEVLLPLTRRRSTPWALILGAAAVVFVGILLLSRQGSGPARPQAGLPPATELAEPPPTPEGPGPLANATADLRSTIESTLATYAKALETQNAALLAEARPDLSPAEREKILEPFLGALNVATDLRVLDVIQEGQTAVVPVLRTDVIVGGRSRPHPPIEESLRFEKQGGTWVLRGAAGS